VASRGTLKTWIRNMLGAESDDPAFPDAVLDPIVQQAADSVVSAIQRQSPGYLSKTVTLAADSGSSRLYTFATQSAAITDFAFWQELRWTDEDGVQLHEARLDELRDAGADHFTVTGPDEAPVVQTSRDSEAGKALWLRYTYSPSDMADDSAVPGGVPKRFHDVIALEALFAFGLGGEQRMPPELFARWTDRRGELLAHVGRRGVQPGRSRIYTDIYD
jgi:hypothetical protein